MTEFEVCDSPGPSAPPPHPSSRLIGGLHCVSQASHASLLAASLRETDRAHHTHSELPLYKARDANCCSHICTQTTNAVTIGVPFQSFQTIYNLCGRLPCFAKSKHLVFASKEQWQQKKMARANKAVKEKKMDHMSKAVQNHNVGSFSSYHCCNREMHFTGLTNLYKMERIRKQRLPSVRYTVRIEA